MVKMMVWMTTGQVDSHIAGRFSSRSVCVAQVEVQPMLFGTFSFSILSSVVAISMTSKGRPRQPRSPPLSPPLPVRQPQTHAAHMRGDGHAL